MSTTQDKLKFLWTAVFKDGQIINQPDDDKYSKHDDEAEWNPSAFRDVQDKGIENVAVFGLANETEVYAVNLELGQFSVGDQLFSLEEEPLQKRKLVFFREVLQHQVLGQDTGAPYVNRYILGYEGRNSHNKVEKKFIYIDG